MYKSGMNLVDIAKEIGKPPGTVRRWKSTQGWDSERSDKKANVRKQGTEQIEAIAPEVQEVISNPNLTDKQRLFVCSMYDALMRLRHIKKHMDAATWLQTQRDTNSL